MGKHLISFGKFQYRLLRKKNRKSSKVDLKTWKQNPEECHPVNPDLSMPNYRELG